MVVALPKRLINKQTNKHTKRKKIFVSVSESHDDVGYLLDHSVSSSPQRPRLRCTLPFLWPTMYGCCSMYQAWSVVLFFFKAVHLALNSFPWWWRYIYPFSPHRFTVIWNWEFNLEIVLLNQDIFCTRYDLHMCGISVIQFSMRGTYWKNAKKCFCD